MSSLVKLRRAIRSRLPIPRSWIFSYIYRYARWGSGESRSGCGSSLAYTHNLREELPAMVSQYRIRTIFDAPCGDFHWLSRVTLDIDRYVGADIVTSMIRDNQRRYADGTRSFIVFDIVRDPAPAVDLIFCRDCLFHLPLALALRALRNFKASGSRYLLTTTFFGGVNKNVASGYHYCINLEAPPFAFPPPILRIKDSPANEDRYMGLWDLFDLTLPATKPG